MLESTGAISTENTTRIMMKLMTTKVAVLILHQFQKVCEETLFCDAANSEVENVASRWLKSTRDSDGGRKG